MPMIRTVPALVPTVSPSVTETTTAAAAPGGAEGSPDEEVGAGEATCDVAAEPPTVAASTAQPMTVPQNTRTVMSLEPAG